MAPKSLSGQLLGERHIQFASKFSLLTPNAETIVITGQPSLKEVLNEEGLKRFAAGEKISGMVLPEEFIDKEKQKQLKEYIDDLTLGLLW